MMHEREPVRRSKTANRKRASDAPPFSIRVKFSNPASGELAHVLFRVFDVLSLDQQILATLEKGSVTGIINAKLDVSDTRR